MSQNNILVSYKCLTYQVNKSLLTAGEGLETVPVNQWVSRHKKYKDGSKGERPSWRWKFDENTPLCGMLVTCVS